MPPSPTKLILAPVALALLTACAKTDVPAPIASAELCKSWRHQTISKNDVLTEKTAAQIEGNNHARKAWSCAYGENRAKGRENG